MLYWRRLLRIFSKATDWHTVYNSQMRLTETIAPLLLVSSANAALICSKNRSFCIYSERTSESTVSLKVQALQSEVADGWIGLGFGTSMATASDMYIITGMFLTPNYDIQVVNMDAPSRNELQPATLSRNPYPKSKRGDLRQRRDMNVSLRSSMMEWGPRN